MNYPDRMKWVDAEFVQEGDIVMHDRTLFRIVKVERPYAVIRPFCSRGFGEREILLLEGRYFRPSKSFLAESGLFDGALHERSSQPDCVVDVAELIADGQRQARFTAEAQVQAMVDYETEEPPPFDVDWEEIPAER